MVKPKKIFVKSYWLLNIWTQCTDVNTSMCSLCRHIRGSKCTCSFWLLGGVLTMAGQFDLKSKLWLIKHFNLINEWLFYLFKKNGALIVPWQVLQLIWHLGKVIRKNLFKINYRLWMTISITLINRPALPLPKILSAKSGFRLQEF